MQPYAASPDPYQKVRSTSGTLVILLGIRAAMRLVTYLVFTVMAPGPESGPEALDRILMIDRALLGIESLVGLVAMIVFLVWIYRVLKAIRQTGRDAMSPGLAVGGWFIPLANVVLPWLSVRSALRGVDNKAPLAGIWWLVWLVNMSLGSAHQLVRQLSLMPELYDVLPMEIIDSMTQSVGSTFWVYFFTDTAAWGLLALIVVTVRKAVTPAGAA